MATTTKKTTTAKSVSKETKKDILSRLKSEYDQVFDDGGIYCVKSNDKWGFVGSDGEVKISPRFKALSDSFVEDIIITFHKSGMGFVNKNGEEIVKSKYASVRDFCNGMAAVYKDGKWGFVDKTGKEVVPLKYDYVENYKANKAKVRLGTKEFYIDKKGKVIEDDKKTSSETQKKKVITTAKPVSKETKKDILSRLKSEYDQVFDDGGIYCVKSNDKWGFVGSDGEVKISPRFKALSDSFVEDIIITFHKSGMGFVNKNGEEIVKSKYASVRDFCNGMAAVYKDGKWGFVDKTGKEVVPLKYDSVENYKANKAKVRLGAKEFYIDKKGKVLDKK